LSALWLISHHPAILLSHNKSITSNQPTILFSQNKSAPATRQTNTLEVSLVVYAFFLFASLGPTPVLWKHSVARCMEVSTTTMELALKKTMELLQHANFIYGKKRERGKIERRSRRPTQTFLLGCG
jgi:hypothetical protein